MNTVMKKCCGLCPYSKKGTLWLSPDRVVEFAVQAHNLTTDFVCHKTAVTDDDHPDEDQQGSFGRGEKSLTCAGFYAMQNKVNRTKNELEIEFDEDEHFSNLAEMIRYHNHSDDSPY